MSQILQMVVSDPTQKVVKKALADLKNGSDDLFSIMKASGRNIQVHLVFGIGKQEESRVL